MATLSVVIVIASDTVRTPARVNHLRYCLNALRETVHDPALDIIVPHLPGTLGVDALASDFPEVRFLAVPEVSRRRATGACRDHHDELRARGLAVARGTIVAMLEDHEVPAADWAAKIITAHADSASAGIGGAVENSVDRALNWAVFLCDFAQYMNPLSRGASPVATDVNVSYKRDALEAIAPVWQTRFHERLVHAALDAQGFSLSLSPAPVVRQRRLGLAAPEAVVERFVWGRAFAATRAEQWSVRKRAGYVLGGPLLPGLLVARIITTVLGKGRCYLELARALPWIIVLTIAWSLGEMVGYGTRRTTPLVPGRPPIQAVPTP